MSVSFTAVSTWLSPLKVLGKFQLNKQYQELRRLPGWKEKCWEAKKPKISETVQEYFPKSFGNAHVLK